MTEGVAPARTVFRTRWFEIEEFDEKGEPYYRFLGPDAVVIFTVTRGGDVVLVRQHRPARGHDTLEIPAGAVEGDETPEAAARRELQEETGYSAGEFHYLSSGGLRLDRDSAIVHVFAALDAFPLDGGAPECAVVLEPLAQFRLRIEEGRFEQLGALSAVLQTLLRFGHRVLAFSNPVGPHEA
jgi:8-oxo-dGTP pyrophosphatase MutT (NUDIX family)